jgi:hypothetical protein
MEAKNSHSALKLIGAGAGCLLLVVGVGAFLLSRFYFYMRGPTRMIDDHIDAINTGNYELAYTHFSEDLKRDVSYQNFKEDLDGFSSMLPTRSSDFSKISVRDDRASVEGTLTGRDWAIFPVQYELIREKGVWKIVTYHWISPGERIRI